MSPSLPITPPSTVHPEPVETPTLGAMLAQGDQELAQLGSAFDGDRNKLQSLRRRLQEERFHLAVLGQFKRGKSTLLNALLGAPLLPTSVTPLTAIPTLLAYGASPEVSIHYLDGQPEQRIALSSPGQVADVLVKYATEEGNPQNRLNVLRVEAFLPSPLLQQGVVLIDTPGIGSTLRHNTEVTLAFLSQCDAALFLVSADPPLTEVEVDFLQQVRKQVARIFFILNKTDYLTPAEQEQVLAFLRKVLREQAGVTDPGPIFNISARRGLQARQAGDDIQWRESGMAALEEHLLHFLLTDKTRVLEAALAHKAANALKDALMQVQLTRRTLQLPIADLEARQALFANKLQETQRERIVAQDLLEGDHKRLAALLEEQAAALRERTRAYFTRIVDEALVATPDSAAPEEAASQALAQAIPGFFDGELQAMSRAFGQRLQEVLEPHRQRADALVAAVRQAAAEIFDIPYRPLDTGDAFILENHPYWVTQDVQTTLSPFSPDMTDRLLPARMRRQRRRARLQEKIDVLVTRNVENLRWATRQNLDQAIRRFSSQLDERLSETIDATGNAIAAARERRQARAEDVSGLIAELTAKEQSLEHLITAITGLIS